MNSPDNTFSRIPWKLLPVLALTVLLQSCAIDVCRDVDCNSGICEDGYCDCFNGYRGEFCDQENSFYVVEPKLEYTLYPTEQVTAAFLVATEDMGLPSVSFSTRNVPEALTVNKIDNPDGTGTTVTAVVKRSAAPGEYSFQVVSTSDGGTERVSTLKLNVQGSDFEIAVEQPTIYAKRYTNKQFFLNIEVTEGVFRDLTFSAFNTPPNTSVEFDPPVLTENKDRILITINSSAPEGTYSMAIDAENSEGTKKRSLFKLAVY